MELNLALAEKIVAGDERAAAEFIHAELPKVYALCFRLSGNRVDAEDLSQQVFVKAVRALKNFKGNSSLSTWLYRIAINTWKNHVRYETRRKRSAHVSLEIPSVDGETYELPIEDKSLSPERAAEVSESHDILLRAMDMLDVDDRSIITLKDVEDKSYEEIAEIMELNVGTVKSRLSRARQALRELFQRLGGRTPR